MLKRTIYLKENGVKIVPQGYYINSVPAYNLINKDYDFIFRSNGKTRKQVVEKALEVLEQQEYEDFQEEFFK